MIFIKNIRNAVSFLLNKFRKNFNKILSIHFYTFNLTPLLGIFETRSESVFAIHQTRRSWSPFLELLSSFSFAEPQFCRLKSDTNEWIFTVDAGFPSYVPYLNRVIVASANNGVKRVSFEHARRMREQMLVTMPRLVINQKPDRTFNCKHVRRSINPPIRIDYLIRLIRFKTIP